MPVTGTATVKVKIIPGGSFITLFAGSVTTGLTLISVTIYLNLHALLSFAAFITGITGYILLFTRNGTYTADNSGISEEIYTLWKNDEAPKSTFYSWAEIKSWKMKRDMGRSLREKATIFLKMKDGYKMRIYSAYQDITKGPFADFIQAVEAGITHYNAFSGETTFGSEKVDNAPIQKEKTFYDRPWAHLIFWLLLLSTAYTIWLSVETGIFKPYYLVRLIFILPGIAYMYHRLYLKSNN